MPIVFLRESLQHSRFFSFETAWRTLQGYEMMNMMRKGHVQGVAKGDVGGQVALVAKLFGAVV